MWKINKTFIGKRNEINFDCITSILCKLYGSFIGKDKKTVLWELQIKIISDKSDPLQASKDFESVDEVYNNYFYYAYQKANYLVWGFKKYTLRYTYEVEGKKYLKIVSCPDQLDNFIRWFTLSFDLREIFQGFEYDFYKIHNVTIIERRSMTLSPFSMAGFGMYCFILTGALDDIKEY